MNLKMYVVYDSKTEAYLMPHFFRARGEALREYSLLANDKSQKIAHSPADYTFFEIGEYDDCSGVVTMYPAKISLGTAIEYQKIDSPIISKE